MNPKVSVLMSCYNHENFVAKAIKSVIGQSFEDWELLIIDDCSSDKTFEIAKEYNTNFLIEEAKGEYIAIINSDDFWHEKKLEKQVNFLDNNQDFGACFTLTNAVDENDKIIKKYKNPFFYLNKTRHQWLNHFFYKENNLCYPSSLVRKLCYEKVGFFNPAFICLLDLNMWIKICLAGFEIKILEEKLTNFRITKSGNLSGIKKPNPIRTRNSLEGQMILHSFCEIKNFEEFTKIFPDYIYDSKINKNHETSIYLLDLCLKSFERKKKFGNSENIKNFALHLLYKKVSQNYDNLKILEKDFGYSFKKHLEATTKYPHGINNCLKRTVKKQKYIIIFMTIILLGSTLINL